MTHYLRHVVSKPPYGNCRILAPDGSLMVRAEEKRILWYLDRGLAEKILDDPPTIRLLFEPKGRGNEGDIFYLSGKRNVCVVCGSDADLTMHHLLPKCYFKFFPETMKSHCAYDLMPLCVEHHSQYELLAMQLKKDLAEEYDAPLHDRDNVDSDKEHVWRMAGALIRYSDKIPDWRKEEISDVIRNFLGKEGELTDEDLDLASRLTKRARKDDADRSPHGRKVVRQILKSGVDEFAIRWRRHFLDTMKPRFLPDHWDPERRIYTGNEDDLGREKKETAPERVHEDQGDKAEDPE